MHATSNKSEINPVPYLGFWVYSEVEIELKIYLNV
jgi:hypothetical protein